MIRRSLRKGDSNDRHSRREVLQRAALCGLGAASAAWWGGPACAEVAATPVDKADGLTKLGWTLACQHYTFRRYSLYEAAPIMAKLRFSHVEGCFFLPLDKEQQGLVVNETLSSEKRAELRDRLRSLGLTMANFYGDVGADKAKARQVFEFAKAMGSQTVVAEPPPAAFGMLDELTAEFGIDLAIHNHPKSPQSQYWHPKNVLEACRGRSSRIGACCDTGHWVRSGLDPIECLKMMEGRIKTFHLKDVAEWAVPEARDVPLGQGKARYADVLAELRRQGFRGVLSVEYEHDSDNLENDVAQCVRFVVDWADRNA